ncbi:unnamed protein product [Phytophthora fragariaefolia]|uniref:Unnamed protein product n=1 Tax=Phytophthora fragariaefolia TaxID=1490495 RepID=A0A9W6Y159_9STRA|nr:unnamed protein product [Phytophthora fragariaefolia]
MMEALGDDPAVSAQSLVNEESIVKALREMLPSMDANTVTLKAVMQKVAVRFGMDFPDLKAQWRPRIKALLPDLLGLCAGGDVSEAEGAKGQPEANEEEEEEEADLRPSRKRTERSGKKRNTVVEASEEEEEEEDGGIDSDASESDAAKPEEDDEDDVAPVKKKRRTCAHCCFWSPLQSDDGPTKKRKGKEAAPPVKRPKASKQEDPAGLALLKELGRAAGVLKLLKSASSTEEAEEILRDRLLDAGISFSGSYPTSRDISTAKRKHAKEKELEGIDTSLIISGGRSRRGAAQPRISYKEDPVSGEEENADDDEDDEDEEEEEDDNEDDGQESAASDSDASEESF